MKKKKQKKTSAQQKTLWGLSPPPRLFRITVFKDGYYYSFTPYAWVFSSWKLSIVKGIFIKWAPSSEFVSSSIPSWQILNAHAQPFRGVRDLAFCLTVPLDSLLVWASSEGSGETARMRRLAWTFAARKGDKYQIRLTRPKWFFE